ncbi:phosphoribosylformylglycinamidine synthase subunit PurL [Baekduia soli]|uniref:Phosphoribosylformylglycinamidine synthase subunit PurL n=1 Tax=Baekduia soli TaxID=496014 RepID=A0A5B8U1R5_9ACTN|nr:phosphoribosylformylglycinamidine synthase subunit PurL [Baekduia soli]QEC47004.1 phosphoribosylformylglycinamidine synthase subunit PurL [Baekduia soli]
MSPSPEPGSDDTVAAPGIERAVALGLTRDEYALVCDELGGREPNEVELAMFSLLWSEHCAYKHSKKLLRTLPTEGPAVVMGPGENAGAVDVGGGWAVAFKVESHNHPSAVEPFQGAATGVGGILRDIFALGARPIAVLDSLRFGEPTSERSRYLLDRAVAGIGHYGNSIGVPTVGGEVVFEAPYETNCLVNAMALGLARTEDMIRSAAAGVGNVLVLFGASTGRDGIGGASVLASAELDAADESKRPSVQVGDPFEESKLLECSLELLSAGLLVALQDLGAAGLTSAASEMASKGDVGLDLDVGLVPLREADMEPFEIMVSESQERMLCVCEPDKVDAVLALCEKWEVNGTAIGEVTATGRFRVLRDGEVVGDMPVSGLVDDAPLYDLAPERPVAGGGSLYPAPVALPGLPDDVHGVLVALLSSPNLASRRPLFEQYDSIVQSRTVRRPEEADAAVLWLREMGDGAPAIATSIDGNGRRVAADPYWGTVGNVLECAANLACVGARPLGTTNNLNFANPEKPHVAWQLTEAVRGLGDACRALDAPIVGGNVSLYNEGAAGPIYPTPVVGMVGVLADPERAGRLGFARDGDAVAFVGWDATAALAASELAKLRGEPLPDGLAPIDIAGVRIVLEAVRDAVAAGELSSAHDIAEGGPIVALAECCLAGGRGAALDLGDTDDVWAALFGEASGAFVVSGPREALHRLGERVAVEVVGTVGGDGLELAIGSLRERWTLHELRAASGALAPLFP